jgi:ribosomal protein L37AE/L43A
MTAPVSLDAALRFYRAGLSVLPVKEDGSKEPDGKWKQYEETRPTEAQVRAWFANGRAGIGAVMGKVSGNLELFEFDDLDTYHAFKGAAQATGSGELVERIEQGCSDTTPGGGIHWYTRCSEIAANTKLAQRPQPTEANPRGVKTLIETRGEGGYSVMAPSGRGVHPTGRSYTVLAGSIETIATITPEERRELWALARTFDEMPVKEEQPAQPAAKRIAVADGSLSPGDDFNTRASWANVLEPHGWVHVYSHGGTDYWRRPGKDRGVSATTNHTGRDTLINFSSSVSFDTAPSSYSKFGAFAELNHSGDFSAAAAALKYQGYGASVSRPTPRVQDAPLSDEGECPETVAALRAEIAVLRSDLAIARKETTEARQQAREAHEMLSQLQAVMRNPKAQRLRQPGIVIACRAANAIASGTLNEAGEFKAIIAGPKGSPPVPWSLAYDAGTSGSTMSSCIKELEDLNLMEVRRVPARLGEHVDQETGEVVSWSPPETWIKPLFSPVDFLKKLQTLEREKPHGGDHRCPKCGSTQLRTVTVKTCLNPDCDYRQETTTETPPDAQGDQLAPHRYVPASRPGLRGSTCAPYEAQQLRTVHQATAPLRARELFDSDAQERQPRAGCVGCGTRDWIRAEGGGWLCRICEIPPGREVEPVPVRVQLAMVGASGEVCWTCADPSNPRKVPAVGLSESGRPACERHKEN